MESVPPFAQAVLWLLSLFLSPPPATGPAAAGPELAAAVPGDTMLMASADIRALRARAAALEEQVPLWANRLRPMLRMVPEFQEEWLDALDNPMALVRGWQRDIEPTIADLLGSPADEWRGFVEAMEREHLLFRLAPDEDGDPAPGVAYVIEGPDSGQAVELLSRLLDLDAGEWGLAASRENMGGREWLVIDTPGGPWAVGGVGRRTVAAWPPEYGQTVAAGLDGRADAETVAGLMDRWNMAWPDAGGAGALARFFVNLPEINKFAEASIQEDDDAEERLAMDIMMKTLDMRSMGPVASVLRGDGGLSHRQGLATPSDLRRWFEGDSFGHEAARLDPGSLLAVFSGGVADGPALWKDILDRTMALASDLPQEDEDDLAGGVKAIMAARLMAEAMLGEPVENILGRLREAALVMFVPAADDPMPDPEDPAMLGFWLFRSVAITLKFDSPESLDRLWTALKAMSVLMGDPGLPEEFPAPDAGGFRSLALPIPDLPVPDLGIHLLAREGRLAISLFAEPARRALANPPEPLPAGHGSDFARWSINTPVLLRLAADLAGKADQGAAQVFSLLPDGWPEWLPSLGARYGIDAAGLYGEMEGAAALLAAVALAAPAVHGQRGLSGDDDEEDGEEEDGEPAIDWSSVEEIG